MRRLRVSIFSCFIFVSLIMQGACKTEKAKTPQSKIEQSAQVDDFSDLKAKEGGCKTEEDLKKKLEEEAKAKKPSKLQGGNTDCLVN